MDRSTPVGLRPVLLAVGSMLLAVVAPGAQAQAPDAAPAADGEAIELTLERMVELALSSSYRVRHLNLDIERTRLNLQASRARLKSRVDLEFTVPTINYVSEDRWDPDLLRNVIQRENSRRVEAELSVRQPVILFGYPTNGYLSLNSRMYRLRQVEGDDSDVRYYNRYFVQYRQPLFAANELKNDLEEAELDLEDQELEFYDDVVGIIDNTADDYFELFEIAYQRQIRMAHVGRLEAALALARTAAAADPDRSIDVDQIQVELANAREDVTSRESRFRLESSRLMTELGLSRESVVTLDPVIELARVPIDAARATRYALQLTPRMRQLQISHREREIQLDNRKGRGGLDVDVAVSYGREMQNEVFGHIWDEPENSYTVDVEGSIPLWDWGERDARIRAQEISLRQSGLRIEETTQNIEADIENEVRTIAEYEERAFNMQENLGLSRDIAVASMNRYETGAVSALDLLQSLRREVDTAENFLDAYLGWRRALQRIQRMTYYDWERDALLLERFGISFEEGVGNDR